MANITYRVKTVCNNTTEMSNIDANDFCALKRAKDILYHALLLEEKYEILLSNFLDFEQEGLKIITENKLYSEHGYSEFVDIRLRIDRRLLNFLSAAKLYIDHSKQDARKSLNKSGKTRETLRNFFSEEYDGHFEYRFMEALRNHTQHRGLPTHRVSRGAGWNEDRTKNIYNFSASSSKLDLKSAKGFKAETLEEMPEQVDLSQSARVYLECISRVHDQIRSLIDSDVAAARSMIIEARNYYLGKDKRGFVTVQVLDSENIIKRFDLMLDWDDVRVSLQSKNHVLIGFRHRQISSD